MHNGSVNGLVYLAPGTEFKQDMNSSSLTYNTTVPIYNPESHQFEYLYILMNPEFVELDREYFELAPEI